MPPEFLPQPELDQCSVLVVDDDEDCLVEYRDLVEGLGYPCIAVANAADALRTIAADPGVGVVVTDVHMPAMDGLTLLEELSSRFMPSRPLVALVITGETSLNAAVQAMRSNAIDFLEKPVSLEDFSAALRRASLRWIQLVGQFRMAALSRLTESRRQMAPLAERESGSAPHTPRQLQAFVRSIMKSRQSRADFLDPVLFSDPAWDILLDLTSAALDGKPVPASSACAATQAPLSTALRYVRQLTDAGLIRSWKDPTDKRRTLLELEPATFESMKAYLATISQQRGVPGG